MKQKRDNMKVEINMKNREIERYKYMLIDVKKEIETMTAMKGCN